MKQASPNENPKRNQETCAAASAALKLTAMEPFSCSYGTGFARCLRVFG